VRTRRLRARAAGIVLAVAVVPLGAGCGASEEPSRDPGVVAAGPDGRADRPGDGVRDTVRVGLTEWKILTSVDHVPSGTVRLRVTNAGATEHDLVVEGRAGTWRTDDLDPGAAQRLSVEARPGETLRLWCSEPGHETQGMHTTLRVAS